MKKKDTAGFKTKWYYCGCYTINASGKKIMLKSNVDYSKEHPKHSPNVCIKNNKHKISEVEMNTYYYMGYGKENKGIVSHEDCWKIKWW